MSIDAMARAAGFRKAGEVTTASTATPVSFAGMDIVSCPMMPDGFFAMRTERGALVVGPNGSHWVPFWPSIKGPSTDAD